MYTLGKMAQVLHRPAVYLSGLQDRFELPRMEGEGYAPAYLEFLRKLVFLRVLGIPEESILELWHLERKLMQLLHADSTGSRTWFLDSCGQPGHAQRRLLLSHYDMGVALPSGVVQLGLDFSGQLPELFAGREMGEDALRVMAVYLEGHARMRERVKAELPVLRSATRWAGRWL